MTRKGARLNQVSLPAELVSLVHHVQLNEAGWWDESVQRLVLASLWLAERELSVKEILEHVSEAFHVTLKADQIEAQLTKLERDGVVVGAGNAYRIGETSLGIFEKEMRAAQELEVRVRERFVARVSACCRDLDPAAMWDAFNARLLLPTVANIGARTYELVTGGFHDLDNVVTLQRFLGEFPQGQREGIRKAVGEFLDPDDADVRGYILRQMNAFFVVEASQLSQQTVDGLARLLESKPRFTILADTNFIFSVLGLHPEPVNDAARQLLALIGNVRQSVDVKVYIAPPTVDEARAALDAELAALGDIRWTPNMAAGAIATGSLGEVGRHFAERCVGGGVALTPRDFFSPYVKNLVMFLRRNDLEVYNENFQAFEGDASVTKDVEQQLKAQEKSGRRPKSRAQLRHDVTLWHFVDRKRPARVDSPLDATYWFLTEDFRLIGFDQYKRKKRNGDAPPVCVHPLALVQMLQFWVGRTPEIEEALLSGLRMSFLFQPFDQNAERVTVRILEHLSMYEGVQDLPPDAITATLLNQAIRQRVTAGGDRNEEAALVRDALIAEYGKVAAARDQAIARLGREEEARSTAEAREAELTREVRHLNEEVGSQRSAFQRASAERDAERSERERLSAEMDQLREAVSHAKQREDERSLRERRRQNIRGFVWKQMVAPGILLAALSIGAAAALFASRGRLIPSWWVVAAMVALVSGMAWLWWIDRRGRRDPDVRAWALYSFIRRHKKPAFGVVGAIGVGLLVNIVWEMVKSDWQRNSRLDAKERERAVAPEGARSGADSQR